MFLVRLARRLRRLRRLRIGETMPDLFVWVWHPDYNGGFHAVYVEQADNAGYGVTRVRPITGGTPRASYITIGSVIDVATKYVVFS